MGQYSEQEQGSALDADILKFFLHTQVTFQHSSMKSAFYKSYSNFRVFSQL